jgi:hypothetical protein
MGKIIQVLDFRTSTQAVAAIHGAPHVLVPFAIEDGSRLGARALALLEALAILAREKGMRLPFAYRAHAPSAHTLTSM